MSTDLVVVSVCHVVAARIPPDHVFCDVLRISGVSHMSTRRHTQSRDTAAGPATEISDTTFRTVVKHYVYSIK